MSIVSYYARVDAPVLEALEANPDVIYELPDRADQLLYLDKDWMALSWLLSAKSREEQKHTIVGFALSHNKICKWDPANPVEWDAAKAQEAAKRGFLLVDTDSMPDDPVLTAIQGRGLGNNRFQTGYHTRTFDPAEVADLSAALDRITAADLREHFDPVVTEALDVGGIPWTDEEESDVLEKMLIPCFERLRAFYSLAAQAGHTSLSLLHNSP